MGKIDCDELDYFNQPCTSCGRPCGGGLCPECALRELHEEFRREEDERLLDELIDHPFPKI